MARQKSTGSKQDRTGSTAAGHPTRTTGPEPERPGGVADDPGTDEQRPGQGHWADEAARARTADDPRRVTPHDRAGVPSTGDRR